MGVEQKARNTAAATGHTSLLDTPITREQFLLYLKIAAAGGLVAMLPGSEGRENLRFQSSHLIAVDFTPPDSNSLFFTSLVPDFTKQQEATAMSDNLGGNYMGNIGDTIQTYPEKILIKELYDSGKQRQRDVFMGTHVSG